MEAILRTHPDILEAAVIGIPDVRCGEVPKAFVVIKKDSKINEEEVKEFMKGKVSEFKELKGIIYNKNYIINIISKYEKESILDSMKLNYIFN